MAAPFLAALPGHRRLFHVVAWHIEQYKEKNAVLEKDIPLLKEIANKQWKKEDELKGLKSELAALDRKIQLELAKDNEPQQQQAEAKLDYRWFVTFDNYLRKKKNK